MLFITFDNPLPEFNNPYLQALGQEVIEVFYSIYYYS